MEKVHSDGTRIEAKKSLSIEERLMPKINEAEYLLILVLALMLWTAGFVDLFTHTSQDSQVLGLYSLPYFLLLIAYSLGYIFWGALIFPANSITWFKRGIHAIQQKPLLGIGTFILFGLLLFSMFIWERWVSFPLLEAATALLVLMASATILLARPFPEARVLPWRKALITGIGLALLVEAALQGLSLARLLPIQNYNGLFTHSGRVYQNKEGYTNTTTNRLGWYYPDFRLTEGSRRIILTGDTFVQGLQVGKEETLGALLDEKIRAAAEVDTEVLALGQPGYGPGLYLDLPLYPYIIEPVQPAEIIVVFHLANDFQTISGPSDRIPYFHVEEDGIVDVHPGSFTLRHELQHRIIRGYEPVNPVRTVASHLFLFSPIDNLASRLSGHPQATSGRGLNFDQVDEQQPLGASSFVFYTGASEEAAHALQIATGLLKNYKKHLDDQSVRLRLVTVPYFPPGFYEQNQGSSWESQLGGEYDLFLPEQALAQFARENAIDFLPMGQYLQESGLSVEQIQALFYENGSGHFTPEGHRLFANAIYDCFFNEGASCPVP